MIEFPIELWWESVEPRLDGQFHKYTGADGLEIQRAEFQTTLDDIELAMSFQAPKDGRDVAFEVRAVRTKGKVPQLKSVKMKPAAPEQAQVRPRTLG
jgi:hypothetical protein